jgi:hypothetical protein
VKNRIQFLHDQIRGVRDFNNRIISEIPEALSWSYYHEMWHCAEMELAKRLLGHPIKWL